ncbi:MAG: hypothetical protein HQ557_03575 [Bacteroidetes bacterium]|nr:hypothetical protein [Bacteroidota bacterium]
MNQFYRDLDTYSDIVDFSGKMKHQSPVSPGEDTQRKIRKVLGFNKHPEAPKDVRIEQCWSDNDLDCEEISWSAGYGPRTKAWLYLPKTINKPVPGILALHCHSGIKYFGKEKIAKGPVEAAQGINQLWDHYYGGRPYVNALAREGFAVLVHDVFSWGSRRFSLEAMGQDILSIVDASESVWGHDRESDFGMDQDVKRYNRASQYHEPTLEKYCNLLGSTYAGIINYEDRVAVNYLLSRKEVDSSRIGCIGLSGGGCRSGLLQAVCNNIKAAVIVGMMSTYAELLDHCVQSHTFMLFPAGWSRLGDWPDLVAARAPSPLLVQYDIDDALFPLSGMKLADQCLQQHYSRSGSPRAYEGQFYQGSHKFDLEMQQNAFSWLKSQLGVCRTYQHSD